MFMAIYKGIKTGHSNPLYKITNNTIEIAERENDYFVRTDIAMIYLFVYHIFKKKEPDHPLLEMIENPRKKFVTYDAGEAFLSSVEDAEMYFMQSVLSGLTSSEVKQKNIIKEVELPTTPLLEYFAKHYSQGFKTRIYYVNSRRLSSYDSLYVKGAIVTYLETLGFPCDRTIRNERLEIETSVVGGLKSLTIDYSLSRLLDILMKIRFYSDAEKVSRIISLFMSEDFFSPNLGEDNERHINFLKQSVFFTLDDYLADFNKNWNSSVEASNSYSVSQDIYDYIDKKMRNEDKSLLAIEENSVVLNINEQTSFYFNMFDSDYNLPANSYSSFRKNASFVFFSDIIARESGYYEVDKCHISGYNATYHAYLSKEFTPNHKKPELPKKKKEEKIERYEQLSLIID